jgi:hypothetical protein
MHRALENLFEEQVAFQTAKGDLIEGSIFIGETEFLPVEMLREDADAYKSESERWVNDIWLPTLEERRDVILRIHGNAKRYADLIKAIERRQVIPLIGSGMSVPSGCPTWSDLLRKIRKFTIVDADSLETLLNSADFEEAADLLASGTNPNLLDERVEHDLRVDDPKLINGAVRLVPAIFPSLAITTNLDDVLEQLYLQCETSFTYVLAGSDISRYRRLKNPNSRFLLKLHGDCRQPSTRVLLTAEYDKAYGLGNVNREELALLYRSNNLLFMGCSLGPDRTVELISEVAKADKSMPKHYAFLRLPDTDRTRIERENFLSERGIYPIWYDEDHDTALIVLLSGLLLAADAL